MAFADVLLKEIDRKQRIGRSKKIRRKGEWAGHRRWVERKGRGGEDEKEKARKRQTQRARRNRRKKNQANWYAAHNNRRVERRGSEVRPARGSYVWREGGINTLSFSRLLLHVRRHAHENERVDTRAVPPPLFSCFSSFSFFPPSFLSSSSSPRSSLWQIPKHPFRNKV